MRRLMLVLAILLSAARAEAITATLQFPTAGGTQYGGSFAFAWIVLSTDVNATCKYGTSNVAYASLPTFFTNTGAWTFHVVRFEPSNADPSWPTYTYYYACSDDSSPSTVTATASVTYTVDSTYPGTIARDLSGTAKSDTIIGVGFSDPTDTSTTTGYKIYRNGTLAYSTSQFGCSCFNDTGLTANTTYTYTGSVVLSGVEQPQSPAFPVHTLPAGIHETNSSAVLKLEDFESGNTVINPGETQDYLKYLYSVYPACTNAGDPVCVATISTPTVTPSADGTHAFDAHMLLLSSPPPSSGPMYFQMSPFLDDNSRHFSREYLKTGSWQFNTFNRFRFWIKTPSDWPTSGGGHQNIEFGTFVRSSHGPCCGTGAEESGQGGNHYYHFFDVPHTDGWYQVIVDTHVSHQRGAPGSLEYITNAHFSGEPTWNYFDAFSRWYIDTTVSAPSLSYPDDFFVDDFEFFNEDESTTDINHIYSLNGGYDAGSHTVYVGYAHPKDDGTTKADIRYAFSDLYALGFTNGTVFPGTTGGVSPLDSVESCMLVSSAAITTTGHTNIYVGIRAQGDTGFRQIVIPLNGATTLGVGPQLRMRGKDRR